MSSINHGTERYATFLDRMRVVCIAHLVANCIKGLAKNVRRIILVVLKECEYALTEVAFNPGEVLQGVWIILRYGELVGRGVRCRGQIIET